MGGWIVQSAPGIWRVRVKFSGGDWWDGGACQCLRWAPLYAHLCIAPSCSSCSYVHVQLGRYSPVPVWNRVLQSLFPRVFYVRSRAWFGSLGGLVGSCSIVVEVGRRFLRWEARLPLRCARGCDRKFLGCPSCVVLWCVALSLVYCCWLCLWLLCLKGVRRGAVEYLCTVGQLPLDESAQAVLH